MSNPNLNGDQFDRWYPGQVRGLPGEPNPDLFPKYDDFLTEHKRFINATKAGKSYVDRDESLLSKQREAAEREVKGEYRQERAVKRQVHAKRMKTMRGVSKGLSAFGLKPMPRRRRWG